LGIWPGADLLGKKQVPAWPDLAEARKKLDLPAFNPDPEGRFFVLTKAPKCDRLEDMVYRSEHDACPREQKGRTKKNDRSGPVSLCKEGELRR
jgi:hypothetical protein